MAGDAAQAHRRSRQSGARIRAHASQRGLVVRRCAGRAASRRLAARTRASIRSWRGSGVDDAELWLLKPQSFMNRSGAPVAALANFYRIAPAEILVVHDEIDLPPGVARLKQGGGHGGHNGVRDVMAHIGADFWRLRLGVGHPGSKDLVLDAVLDRPTADEQQMIEAGDGARAGRACRSCCAARAQKAMHGCTPAT